MRREIPATRSSLNPLDRRHPCAANKRRFQRFRYDHAPVYIEGRLLFFSAHFSWGQLYFELLPKLAPECYIHNPDRPGVS